MSPPATAPSSRRIETPRDGHDHRLIAGNPTIANGTGDHLPPERAASAKGEAIFGGEGDENCPFAAGRRSGGVRQRRFPLAPLSVEIALYF